MFKITLSEFNRETGSNFAGNDANSAIIEKINALNIAASDLAEFIGSEGYKNRPKNGYHVLREFLKWARAKYPAPKSAEKPAKRKTTPAPAEKSAKTPAKSAEKPAKLPAEKTAEKPAEAPAKSGNDAAEQADRAFLAAMRNLVGAVTAAPVETLAALDVNRVREIIDTRINELLESGKLREFLESLRPAEQRIVVESPRGKFDLGAGTVLHKDFEEILCYVNGGTPVYLYGPSGSGKSEIAKQVARALGLDYYFTGKVDLACDLLGFIDAGGRYNETPFYKAVKYGGLFLFDEIDASSEEALTAFNAALNSGECAFPCGIIQAHPNFRVMAAGNTSGNGGTSMYNSRRKLDDATLNRFCARFFVDYDPRIESALGDAETVEFVQAVREAADNAGIELVMSYRNIKFLSQYAPILGPEKVVNANVISGLSDDDRHTLHNSSEIRDLVGAGNRFAAVL